MDNEQEPNKMLISSFGLKNFRVFQQYTNFDLKPFTILTGTNNSGKSSLTKALLLLKENESEINNSKGGITLLNYFKGDHNLGNHKLVKNQPDNNTTFYLSFFRDFQISIEIQPDGVINNDYQISKGGETVLCQSGGEIKFNYSNFIDYLKIIVSEVSTKNAKKINVLISRLEKEAQKGFHSVEIDLYDYLWVYDYDISEEEFGRRHLELKNNYEELKKKGIFSTLYDLDCSKLSIDYDTLDEDILDVEWYISLIYLIFELTGIEFSKDEIATIIPFPSIETTSIQRRGISLQNIIFIPTIKEQIKRTYSFYEKSLISDLIMKELQARRGVLSTTLRHDMDIDSNKLKRHELNNPYLNVFNFAEKWLQEFEIGKKLSYGYDNDSDTFFIKIDDKHLPEYGFGVSQVLYLIFTLHKEIAYPKSDSWLLFPRTYIIEEPETGLHPAFQSKIAEMIVDAHQTFNVNFIIETHSEYFVRKLQLLTANKTITPDDAIIYYFNNPKHLQPNENLVKEINIDEHGGLSDSFGKGFFDEATSLKFDLIQLNKKQQN